MPRGGGRGPKKNYKGKSRHFTDEENLKEAAEKERREKQWRKQRGEEDSDDEDGAEGGAKGAKDKGSSDSSSSEDEDDRHKGVSHLIDIENPNRNANKNLKISNVDTSAAGPELSRREREEIAKQRAAENYQKLHKEGKTEEARNDMARLQIIRKQREEAAKKREAERLAKEEADKS